MLLQMILKIRFLIRFFCISFFKKVRNLEMDYSILLGDFIIFLINPFAKSAEYSRQLLGA